ncbi:MAG: hypothetical protein IT516_05980 [Burkholderiales bacterium]|nr:hypothetical protein [Burkholderiales bacterium]
MDSPRLVLKSTPPRAHRMAIARPRLDALWDAVHERAMIEICAPSGFGKSTLMVQWRRRWLERGALVAWLTLDAEDTPNRFAAALAYALRVASGRTSFARVGELAEDAARERDALTAILAEVASLATPTILMLDDAERLPRDTVQDALSYFLINAPANLTVVAGTRVAREFASVQIIAHADHARVDVGDLRLDLDEAVTLLRKRFGKRIELDDCVRLHELTEGWPIGLQLAAAAVERAPHYPSAITALSARHGDIERYFIGSLLDRLPEPVVQFLTRIAILDPLSPPLCEAVTGCACAPAFLDQIMADTPILSVAELQGWMRLHTLARDFLLGRFEQLPVQERMELHRRAAAWLADHDHLPGASRHAIMAGDVDSAKAYAGRSLWVLGTTGNLAEALHWLDQFPLETLEPELRLIGAWIMAFSERVERARPIAAAALSDPASPSKVAFVAALVASAIEASCDRIGTVAPIMARWPECPADLDDPVHGLAYANTRAAIDFHNGVTQTARALAAPAPTATSNRTLMLVQAFGRMFASMAFLREADPQRVESLLHPALVHAERTLGRRSAVAGIYAACLAAALVERNEIARAEAMLANRMDVIERFTFPDPILLASRALARLAVAQGDLQRARFVLDNLTALGAARGIPRFTLASLAMRVALYAQEGHAQTAATLMASLEALEGAFDAPEFQPFQTEYRLQRSIARAYVALARYDTAHAEAELGEAAAMAASGNRTRDALTVQVLQAVAARQRKADRAPARLAEALAVAAMHGCLRVAEDTHPAAVTLRDEAAPPARPAPATAPRLRKEVAAAGGLLTPKEAEVLQLLAAGHSNKLIARTMDVSDETVKWHLKNLFSKLSAGTRRHAVDRARMMGLLEGRDVLAS